jgi:hypothetical protein
MMCFREIAIEYPEDNSMDCGTPAVSAFQSHYINPFDRSLLDVKHT